MPILTITFFLGFWMLCLFGASPLQASDTAKGKQALHRIVFPTGKSSAVMSGKVVHGNSNRYVLRAKANQKMTFILHAKESNAIVELYTPKGGLIGFLAEKHQWSGWLPISGDYLAVVGATQGTANYSLKIGIENDPGRIARQAKSAGDQDVCTFIAEMVNRDKEKELFSDFDPEIELGGGKALVEKLGLLSETDLPENSWDSASAVDLDNDGFEELRFRHWEGSGYCENNDFFKKDMTGRYTWDNLGPVLQEGGRLCGGNGVKFLRHKDTNYLLVVYVHDYGVPKEIDVYIVTKALNLDLKCTIDIYSNEVEAKSNCSEFICETVKKWIEESLQPQAGRLIYRAEQPIENPESLPIDWDSLTPWMKDGSFFFIDVDNDDVNEILVKRYPDRGLSYSILKMQDGIYQAIKPDKFWPNYETIGPGTSSSKFWEKENLFFEKADGKNYLITVQFDGEAASQKFSMPYKLDIFLIEKSKLSKIGTVNARFLKGVTIYSK